MIALPLNPEDWNGDERDDGARITTSRQRGVCIGRETRGNDGMTHSLLSSGLHACLLCVRGGLDDAACFQNRVSACVSKCLSSLPKFLFHPSSPLSFLAEGVPVISLSSPFQKSSSDVIPSSSSCLLFLLIFFSFSIFSCLSSLFRLPVMNTDAAMR